MKARLLAIGIVFVLAAAFVIITYNVSDEKADSITIAIPKNDKVENFNTNYYTKWLEEKTGYDIVFEYIPPGYEKEYIHTMLTSEHSEIDGVFLSGNEDYLSVEELNSYGSRGLVKDLSKFITEDTNLRKVMDRHKLDGAVYYYPNIDTARKSMNLQVFWINADWLKTLGLTVPKTTEELRSVLRAFRDRDPNGNGRQDELPLLSCEYSPSLQSYNYLLNAFVYNDPMNGRLYKDKDGNLCCSTDLKEFRKGIGYCSELYSEGLLRDDCFLYSSKQLMELVNSPEDLVGAFTCKSIADVIYPNFPDVLAKYIYVPPLAGPDGSRHAVCVDYEPHIGGYVPSNSSHAKEVCRIMDMMLSDEGSLISEFGEKGVDWMYAGKSDLSIYGNKAHITTVNYLGDRTQNKNYAGMGPQILSDDYVNGVTWNGDNSLFEYHDVRAVNLYEEYYPEEAEHPGLSFNSDEKYKGLCEYEDRMIMRFITGSADVNDDNVWASFADGVRVRVRNCSGGS